MKNILLLFRSDLKKASSNMIAIVVLFGVVVIPSFFGWFNVLSSWDPFGNVKNMKVAVANADEGYKGDLLPIKVNVGEQVISTLRANTDLNWVFTSKADAIEGTKSGEYYAALVLPADFSTAMMTFLAPDAKPAEIEYYTNEKKNALSPKITGEAATEVSTKINESFTKTIDEVGLSLAASLADQLGSPQSLGALARAQVRVESVATQLHSAAGTLDMFTSLVASSVPIINGATSLISSSADAVQGSTGAIGEGAGAAEQLKSTLDAAASALSGAFAASAASYQELAAEVDRLYASLDTQSQQAADMLMTLAAQVDTHIDHYRGVRDTLQQQADSTSDPILHDALELVISRVDGVIERQVALRDRLTDAAAALRDSTADSEASRAEVQAIITELQNALNAAQTDYTQSLKPKLDQLGNDLAAINASLASVGTDLSGAATALVAGANTLLDALTHAQITTMVAGDLGETADRVDELAAALRTASETGDFSEIKRIIGSNVSAFAGDLATPVGLKTIAVFKVDSFGAQMTPFYSVLGLWVGALLLSVLIRVDVTKDSAPFVEKVTPSQEYFGRYGIFALLAFFQSSLLYLGIMGFVGVRPVYPFLLLLAGWVMSFVFSLVTYTLVISLGEAGKALAVFLLVVQISAGGGAYPLTVLPQWFQSISPFLPVTHATNAVRSAIAGIYDADYWISLGWLALFIVPMLFIGLVLRRLVSGLNTDLTNALESTKLM